VTPFAAGCAFCGADLEAWRREASARRVALPSPARFPGLALSSDRSKDVALVAALILMSAFSPILGMLFALVGARERHLAGRRAARNVVAAVGVATAALLFFPAVRFGLFQLFL
jgi:hypothetical protein